MLPLEDGGVVDTNLKVRSATYGEVLCTHMLVGRCMRRRTFALSISRSSLFISAPTFRVRLQTFEYVRSLTLRSVCICHC